MTQHNAPDRKNDNPRIYPIDSHPPDSRFRLVEDGIMPTITSKMAKGSADGPLVVLVFDE